MKPTTTIQELQKQPLDEIEDALKLLAAAHRKMTHRDVSFFWSMWYDAGAMAAGRAFSKSDRDDRVNAAILRKRLYDGLYQRVARTLGVSAGHVAKVAAGKRKSSTVSDQITFELAFIDGVVGSETNYYREAQRRVSDALRSAFGEEGVA